LILATGERRGGSTRLVHQLLRDSAIRFPNSIAVKSRSEVLTYADLDSYSDRLAARLGLEGVGRGDRVGILLPKSMASVVSVYSALKAGTTYVPLDADAPGERLAVIAKDCQIRTLLSCSEKVKRAGEMVAKGAGIEKVFFIDCDKPAAGQEPGRSPLRGVEVFSWPETLALSERPSAVAATDDKPAYILYTSGSTGVPKGVVVSHRSCLAFVEWAAGNVALSPRDIVACHAPLHFDISTFSIFSTCKAGGSVLMIPEKVPMFPVQLAALIEQEKVTVWYSVPSVLTLLILFGNLSSRDLSNLRAVVFAGEVFPTKFLRQLMSIVPKARFLNWYGPTETNVCTFYEVPQPGPDAASSVPIGKACPGTVVYAVKDDGREVTSIGEVGELYVRGPTVMQGYWGDPEKTNRVLVTDPLDSDAIACRTGDFVSLDESGNFLFLGRRDGMVKTRGYRVELGEIEAVLNSHPQVMEAVVVPAPDDLVGNRLHAFVSVGKPGGLTSEEILTYCTSRLPKYMIPDQVTLRDALPKTSSGKTDRVLLARSIAPDGVKG